MAYKLDLERDLASAARAAVTEQLGKGEDAIRTGQADDPVEAVHDARKNVKKARALLRLLRSGLDRRTYRRENRLLRDASRTVAHVRDADVMAETVDALHERYAGQLPAEEFDTLRAALSEEAKRARADADGTELAEALRDVAGRVDEWPLGDASWRDARRGIARAYRRGRRAFARADAHPTTENLHEWRKRVKDLWYQQRLLRAAWPGLIGAQAKEAHVLSDLLGDDHDLAVLADQLERDPPAGDTEPLLGLIVERRAELLAQARALGRRVYAEKPKPFARRLKRYLRSAEARDPAPG